MTLALGLAACSGPDSPLDAERQQGKSLSRVTVELVHSRETDARRVSAQALFVRWRGLEVDAIGALLDVPGFGVEDLRPGECRLYNQAAAMGEAADGRADVQLLDAGPILVKTPEIAASVSLWTLQPHRHPDVLPTLSGFVYAASAPTEAAPASEYAVQSGGGEEIGFFSASAAAPKDAHLLAVGGVDPAPGLAIRRASDLLVRMDGTDDGYIELAAGQSDSRVALRCRSASGSVTLSASALAELPSGDGILSAVHAASAPLHGAAGLRGELQVEARDELSVMVR